MSRPRAFEQDADWVDALDAAEVRGVIRAADMVRARLIEIAVERFKAGLDDEARAMRKLSDEIEESFAWARTKSLALAEANLERAKKRVRL